MKNNLVKELLEKSNYMLIALHDRLGIDFESEYVIRKIEGHFTVNSVSKALPEGYDSNNAVIAVLVADPKHRWRNDTYLVTIENKKVNIDHRSAWYKGKKTFDWFVTKGDFEEMRKSETAVTYIIAQKKEGLKFTEKFSPDITGRFTQYEIRTCYASFKGEKYISGFELTDPCGTGETARINTAKININETPIDKSGYIVYYKRCELKMSAENLRKERARNAYLTTDNSTKLSELEELYARARMITAAKIMRATTGAELNKVAEELRWYNKGIGEAARNLDRYRTNTKEKRYLSIEDSDNAYTGIKKIFMEIINATEEIGKTTEALTKGNPEAVTA